MKKVAQAFKAIDAISKAPNTRIHFGEDMKIRKTIIGGICTCFGVIAFLICIGIQAKRVLYRERPKLRSQEVPFEYSEAGSDEPWKMSFDEAYQTIFTFERYSDSNP